MGSQYPCAIKCGAHLGVPVFVIKVNRAQWSQIIHRVENQSSVVSDQQNNARIISVSVLIIATDSSTDRNFTSIPKIKSIYFNI